MVTCPTCKKTITGGTMWTPWCSRECGNKVTSFCTGCNSFPCACGQFAPAPPAAFIYHDERTNVLPTDSEARKDIPIFSGVLNYFPLAIAAVARLSKRGNDKHNPGQPLHWSREKSTDHPDCIARHLIDIETVDAYTGEYEDAAALAWRALAKLQELEERRLGKPYSRGSK
jgi:hypothetical protein